MVAFAKGHLTSTQARPWQEQNVIASGEAPRKGCSGLMNKPQLSTLKSLWWAFIFCWNACMAVFSWSLPHRKAAVVMLFDGRQTLRSALIDGCAGLVLATACALEAVTRPAQRWHNIMKKPQKPRVTSWWTGATNINVTRYMPFSKTTKDIAAHTLCLWIIIHPIKAYTPIKWYHALMIKPYWH